MLAASVFLSPPGTVEQSCRRCHDPALRAQWGCDAPAAEPVHLVGPCFACSGQDDACVHCRGTNQIPIYRCPRRILTAEHEQAVLAALHVESGILPAPGGWMDQSATFVDAYPLLSREIGHWREQHMKRARSRKE